MKTLTPVPVMSCVRSETTKMCKRMYRAIEKIIESNNTCKKGRKRVYYSEFMTFDIETTNIKKLQQSVMYLASMCINGKVYFIRTWEEFTKFLRYANEHLEHVLVCYVHNLAFEFIFMKGVIDFGHDNVFLMDRRKPLTIRYKKIEFRCSYLLSNMSLDRFTKEMNVTHAKLSGYNYSKYRLPWSRLHWLDYRYNGYDTLGLWQALIEFLRRNEDNIASIPLTSTGFVRRDFKKLLRENVNNSLMERLQPEPELLIREREAFRGGNTHANRYYYGVLLDSKSVGSTTKSVDYKSSYPAQMKTMKFPMTKFQKIGACDLNTIERKINYGFALIMVLHIWNIRQVNPLDGFPYLPYSKCRAVKNSVIDNGRILEADYIELTITDLDYKIIKDTYLWDDCVCSELWQAHYKYLPDCIGDELMKLFRDKETLKHVDPYLYAKSKNKFNASFGMSVQNPLKTEFHFIDGDYTEERKDLDKIFEELIEKKFMPYTWGVFITAWARYWLHEAYKVIQEQRALHPEKHIDFIYADTDSLKYIGDVDFTEFNKLRAKIARDRDASFIDNNGEEHILGILEDDGDYTQFITLGAKKYCYRDNTDHKLHLTLAGVSKKGVSELSNNIRNFKEGFVFKKSAGLQATFNDNVDKIVKYQNHDLHITDNIYLKKTTYKLNLTPEYDFAINYAKTHRDEFIKMFDKIVEKRNN